MENKSKPKIIIPPKGFDVTLSLLYILSFICLSPRDSNAIAFFIWLSMIITCSLVIYFKGVGLYLKSMQALSYRSPYNRIGLYSLTHAIFFLSGSLFYKASYFEASGLMFLLSLFFLILAVYFYVRFSSQKSEVIISFTLTIIKLFWLPVYLFTYFFSRSLFMSMIDIPYEQASTKASVAGYALLIDLLIVSLLLALAALPLSALEKTIWRGREKVKKYSCSVIFLPAFLFGLTIFTLVNVNALNLMKAVFNITVPLDTRSTFYCDNRYMHLGFLPNSRYMQVSDSDYRVLRPYRYEYEYIRLKCLSKSPYYILSPIDNEETLKYSTLRGSIYNLLADNYALTLNVKK